MSFTRTALRVALFTCASAAFAVDQIPPELVGVWAVDGAVLNGQLLFEGQAMYLGADGVGAIVGGPPPIGVKIIATFDAQKNTLEFDAYEGKQRGPHGSVTFDPKSKTIDSGAPKHDELHRRFDTFPDETKRALGLM
ncbi:hypothetical protein [Rhodoferax sp. GW822-FHT02A01]|uniref:hypothetical protein n=1 Tax=Rhodoferax sp. GW822-FHT02A01 TaxID=3141537 RepID=UPI00315C7D3E